MVAAAVKLIAMSPELVTVIVKTTVSPTVANVFSWDTSGYHQNSTRGDLRLEHKLAKSWVLGLDYSAEWRQGSPPLGGVTDASVQSDNLSQMLGFDARASGGAKWASYLGATYNLDTTDIYRCSRRRCPDTHSTVGQHRQQIPIRTSARGNS